MDAGAVTILSTPSSKSLSRSVLVAGTLDMLWTSRRSFMLKLDDNHIVPGVVKLGEIAPLIPMLGHRVLVSARAVYDSSGRLVRLEAENMELSPDAPGFWSHVPSAMESPLVLGASGPDNEHAPSTGVDAFFGIWPGSETDDEWRALIKSID